MYLFYFIIFFHWEVKVLCFLSFFSGSLFFVLFLFICFVSLYLAFLVKGKRLLTHFQFYIPSSLPLRLFSSLHFTLPPFHPLPFHSFLPSFLHSIFFVFLLLLLLVVPVVVTFIDVVFFLLLLLFHRMY